MADDWWKDGKTWGASLITALSLGFAGSQIVASQPSGLTAQDVHKILQAEAPYLEDRKVIQQQFQQIDRALENLQKEIAALREAVIETRLLLYQKQNSSSMLPKDLRSRSTQKPQ